jgi:hypothetical protein
MVTDGGGWTLVWSNLRGSRGKPVTELQWFAAINTEPRSDNAITGNLESFTVYTGLKHWMPLAPNGLLRYDWTWNFGEPIAQSAKMQFSLAPNDFYRLSLTNLVSLIPGITPTLFSGDATANGRQFFAYDRDTSGSCSNQYSQTPWWYEACWKGSINGGGEDQTGNGAYWTGNTAAFAISAADTTRAGNGWMYVK